MDCGACDPKHIGFLPNSRDLCECNKGLPGTRRGKCICCKGEGRVPKRDNRPLID